MANAFIESLTRIYLLVDEAYFQNKKSLLLADRSLSRVIDFYLRCKSYDIKPIIGQTISFAGQDIILLCRNLDAYKILVCHSLDFQETEKNPFRFIDFPLTEDECKNFICVSNQSNLKLQKYFGTRFYIQSDFSKVQEITQQVAEKIDYIFPENFFATPEIHKRILDSFPEFENAENQLRLLVREGFEKKHKEFEDVAAAKDRLGYELEDIVSHHWENIFLFHHEIISWCSRNGIEYGLEQGSAASSLVAFLLGITNVNPLKYGLLYERFLNPERLCYPQFCISYEPEKIDDIANHLKEKYGSDHVIKIAESEEISEMKMSRNSAAFVVTKDCAAEYLPVLMDETPGGLYTAYSDKSLDHVGLYRTMLIGLDELTKLKRIAEEINKNTDIKFDYKTVPLNDKKVLAEFSKGKPEELFRFFAPKMEKLIKLKPYNFSDLIFLYAMYCPCFVYKKDLVIQIFEQEKTDEKFFPACDDLLTETCGLPIFQEQIIQIFNRLAGYTYGEGDMLRRAMAKKQVHELENRKKDFVLNTKERGIISSEELAQRYFECLVPLTRNAIQKACSVSVTLMAYWEMYMNVHYPTEYKKINHCYHNKNTICL